MIRFENVSKVYPEDIIVLQDVDVSIEAGEFVSLVGQSGAGKSTFLKLIYAEEMPTTGEVYFDERPISGIKRKHLPFLRRNIGNVFQDFKLFSQKTVFENVAYALEVYGKTNEEIQDEVPQILELVGLTGKENKYPKQLSGGEQQRVSMARALIRDPKVIIADEPTGNLDPIATKDIISLLLEINKLGTTVILATHNKSIVDKIGRRVITLDNGRVTRDEANGKYVL
ncbi:MAG: cell division ATP-binding protein FtsE [Candidatus Moranbacteria bacterium]|nr:cell division ATP-binding protein FtsE [Candidatus Moranbacteria bacterium]